MSEFKVNTITNRDGSYGPQVCGITTFGSSGIQLPSGPTEMRGGRGRGVFAGMEPKAQHIDMIEIATTGNATDFGDVSRAKMATSATASSTRGVVFGGYASPAYLTDIDFITIPSGGGANDFGELQNARGWSAACGDGLRGIVAGTWPGPAAIEYVNIATTGDSSNFGELSVRPAGFTGVQNGHEITGGCGSPTRGIFGGGAFGSPTTTGTNLIQFINIKTLGNSVKFGELNNPSYGVSASSNSIRGLFYGGRAPSPTHDTIDYITIATEGNATDFGNLLANRRDTAACASSTRGIIAGGKAPSFDNVIQYVTIASTGNSVDFGDLTQAQAQMGGFSDVHGGLAQ
jgi:hypothetical protein